MYSALSSCIMLHAEAPKLTEKADEDQCKTFVQSPIEVPIQSGPLHSNSGIKLKSRQARTKHQALTVATKHRGQKVQSLKGRVGFRS